MRIGDTVSEPEPVQTTKTAKAPADEDESGGLLYDVLSDAVEALPLDRQLAVAQALSQHPPFETLPPDVRQLFALAEDELFADEDDEEDTSPGTD